MILISINRLWILTSIKDYDPFQIQISKKQANTGHEDDRRVTLIEANDIVW